MSQPHRAIALPRVPPLRTALAGMGETGLTDAVVDSASSGDGEGWASCFFRAQESCPHCEPQSQQYFRWTVLTMKGTAASAFI